MYTYIEREKDRKREHLANEDAEKDITLYINSPGEYI